MAEVNEKIGRSRPSHKIESLQRQVGLTDWLHEKKLAEVVAALLVLQRNTSSDTAFKRIFDFLSTSGYRGSFEQFLQDLYVEAQVSRRQYAAKLRIAFFLLGASPPETKEVGGFLKGDTEKRHMRSVTTMILNRITTQDPNALALSAEILHHSTPWHSKGPKTSTREIQENSFSAATLTRKLRSDGKITYAWI